MTLLTFGTLFASALAVSAAIIACYATYRGSAGHLSRRFETLQKLFELHSDTLAEQDQAIQNLRSRMTMAATRAKVRGAASSPTADGIPTDESEKARARRELNSKLANGELKPIGR